MPFRFTRVDPVPDVIQIEPTVFGDSRGWFMETYKRSDFAANGIPEELRQDNHSRATSRGVLRGLHYQKDPAAQGKLVRCTVGAVYDVSVDIRKGSPTYGRWVGVELTEANHRMVWVPEGFAHGFCTLSDASEVLYKATAEYSAIHDRGIRWDDPTLAIAWPTRTPTLSAKDAQAPFLADADNTFQWRAP
jgi:dTDP-4-dehydrorhamnose 3,5-epimerase